MLVELANVYDAVRANNMEFLLEFHMNMLNVVGQPGDNTFLHTASSAGSEPIIGYLLDNEVDIDPENREGKTPLMLAYESKQLGAATLLASRGANVNRYLPTGRTLFQQALADGRSDFANLFILNK